MKRWRQRRTVLGMHNETGPALWTGWVAGIVFASSACVDLDLATPKRALGEPGADAGEPTALDAGVANALGRNPLWSKQVCAKPARESVAGAVCNPPIGGDCWDTDDYDSGTRMYARGHIRLCEDGLQVTAYAFGGLDLEADDLGGDGYLALVEVYDDKGQLLGVVTDATKDDGYGGWKTFPTAASIVVKGYVYAF